MRKQIVFYCATSPTIIIYKLGRILKRNHYKTVLLVMSEKDTFDYKFYKEAFDEIYCSNFLVSKRNFKKPLYLLKRAPSLIRFLMHIRNLKPYVVIGTLGNNWQLKLAHKYFFKKHPFIYFPYDIISHYYSSENEALKNNIKKSEINAEKYCFENSDGVMHKGDPDELKFIEGRIHKNIKISSLQLSFLPYCLDEFIIPINKDKISKSEIHLVSPGFLPDSYKFFKKFSRIIKKLSEQKIHMHVYAIINHISKWEEEKHIDNFFRPFYRNKYFHLHKPLDGKKLIPEISKYDFGFLCLSEREKNNYEYIFGMGNRGASYIEAGLPFIYEEGLAFVDKLFNKKYKIAIPFNEKTLDSIGKKLKKFNHEKLRENIEKAREDYDIGKNFPRLEKFIKEVVKKNIYTIKKVKAYENK